MATVKTVYKGQEAVANAAVAANVELSTWYSRLIAKAEASRFALMVMLLLVVTSWASIAVQFVGFDSELWKLSAVVVSTVLTNTLIIAQTSMRIILPMSALTVILSTIILAISI